MSLEADFGSLFLQTLLVAMADEGREVVGLAATKDAVDGMMAGDVLYLASAEIVTAGQLADSIVGERGNQLVPDVLTSLCCGLVELNLIEEATLEGAIHVLLQIGGGDEDAVQRLVEVDTIDFETDIQDVHVLLGLYEILCLVGVFLLFSLLSERENAFSQHTFRIRLSLFPNFVGQKREIVDAQGATDEHELFGIDAVALENVINVGPLTANHFC